MIYIRPIRLEDAKTSYKWRNNPNIWRYTRNKPKNYISVEVESEWLQKKIKCKNELRFAICLNHNDKYIGNIQLTNITKIDAELHIFIGDENYWGLGIGTSAVYKLLDYIKAKLKLESIYLYVNIDNKKAINLYLNVGFIKVNTNKSYIKMYYSL